MLMPIRDSQSRLLVVDDNEMNRDMLSRRLLKQGYAVDMAADGKNALTMMGEQEFDLVLLDIMMPEMDGYEVLARIKEDERLRHIPVVMISAVGETESVVRCIELGADDYLPKPFNPVVLRARVSASLDKKKLRDRERMYAATLERELEIGREIQRGFFPDTLPAVDGWELGARFEPARQVAGDFYDSFLLQSGALAVIVSDVCDKGVGAALYMALFRSLLRATALEQAANVDPAVVLEHSIVVTNNYIAITHGQSNMFATTFFAVVDPKSGEFAYVNAGHEAPRILSSSGVRAHLVATGPALGLLPDLPFRIERETLAAGETLFVFSDGVTEAKGESGFFGEKRLLTAILGGFSSAAELLAQVDAAVAAHVGGFERSDDLTMLALKKC
jgi:sigma-B regulation protein RsbU (phosphoserine phosphatase)